MAEKAVAKKDAAPVVIDHPVFKKLMELKKRVDEDYFKIGIGLYKVKTEQLYLEWAFDSFQEFVERVMDFHIRKAEYLVSIASSFGDVGMGPKDLDGIGWTRLKEITGLIDAEEDLKRKQRTAEKWVDTARKAESVGDLRDQVRAHRGKAAGKTEEESLERPIRVVISMFEGQKAILDQAIEVAKRVGETDHVGQCMEYLAAEFLATHGDGKKEEVPVEEECSTPQQD